MEDKRIAEKPKSGKNRASGFIQINDIIPGVLRDIEKRIKKSHEDKKIVEGNAR